MPMAGCPAAEIAPARRLFSRPPRTITATSLRFAIGHAQSIDELAFDAHALERAGENFPSTVHNQNFMPW